MTREEKKQWMAVWCAKNKLQLELEGECGFGRECVGVLTFGTYPSYHWYDKNTYEEEDENGEVWTPEDAYHKHPCVAVLGRGEEAEDQLYQWLLWFEENNFKLETGVVDDFQSMSMIEIMLGKDKYVRMVKQK